MHRRHQAGRGVRAHRAGGVETSIHFESMEPRLLLSGVVYVVDTLDNVQAMDGHISFLEAMRAAPGYSSSGEAGPGSRTETNIIRFSPALFADGPVVLDISRQHASLIGGSLEIQGPGADLLTLDAGGHYPLFITDAGESLAISGLTFSGAAVPEPGFYSPEAAIVNAGSLTMSDCVITACSVADESSFIRNTGEMLLGDMLFEGNALIGDPYSSSVDEGLISNAAGATAALVRCRFEANAVTYSQLLGNLGEMRLDDTVVTATTMADDGFALLYNMGRLEIGGGEFSYNGGPCVFSADVAAIDRCRFLHNAGRAIANIGAMHLSNSVFVLNTSDGGGAAILNNAMYYPQDFVSLYGTVTAVNCTFVDNRADGAGGAILSVVAGPLQAQTVVYNSIFHMNRSADGLDVSGAYGGGHNLIGVDPHFVRNPSDGGDGLVDLGAGDPRPDYVNEVLNDELGDLRLLPDSPALDAGLDAAAVDADRRLLAVDIAGAGRFYGAAVDIGAWENHGEIVIEAPSTHVTTALDVVSPWDGIISLREAIAYAEPGGVIAIDAALAGMTMVINPDLFGMYGLLRVSKPLTIDATAAPGFTVMENGRGTALTTDSDQEVRIIGLTVRSWSGETFGDAIGNSGVLTLERCTLTSYRRAVKNTGTLTVRDSRISQVYSGVYNEGALALVDTEVVAGRGEAVSGGNRIYLEGCLLQGSAGLVMGTGLAEVIDCEFTGCDWRSIYVATAAATVHVEASRIYANRGPVLSYGTLRLVNSELVGNRTINGVIQCSEGSVALTHCTVADNSVSGSSSLFGLGSTVAASLDNTIVAGNACVGGMDVINVALAGSNNLIGGDPLFVRRPDDGGDGFGDDEATADVDESFNDDFGDLRLRPDSPCVDAGLNALAVDADGMPLSADIDGADRLVHGLVDIGAHEYQRLTGDANGDAAVDILDFVILKQHYGQATASSPAQGDFNGDGAVDIMDFVLLKRHYSAPAAAAAAAPAAAAPSTLLATRTAFVSAPAGRLGWTPPLVSVATAPVAPPIPPAVRALL